MAWSRDQLFIVYCLFTLFVYCFFGLEFHMVFEKCLVKFFTNVFLKSFKEISGLQNGWQLLVKGEPIFRQ